MKKFYMLGGDERLKTVKKELMSAGAAVLGDPGKELSPSGMEEADIIVCGIPFSGDGKHIFAPLIRYPLPIEELLIHLHRGQTLMGGKIPDPVVRSAKKSGAGAYDYAAGEAFELKNAVLTAEGALPLVIQYMKRAVQGANILVIGYGRIGTFLSERLTLLGARVTVATGNRDNLARISGRGAYGILYEELDRAIVKADCIINTAPCALVPCEIWSRVDPDIPLIELASLPGGFAGMPAGRVVSGAALPGKTSPVSAGIIIKDSILEIMKKEGLEI